MKLLVDAGADIFADDNAAIRLASYLGRTEIVKYLIEIGADVTACDNDPIKHTTNTEIVNLLTEAGASI